VFLDGELGFEGRGGSEFSDLLECGIDDGFEVERKRFFSEVIECAELHRFDDVLGGAEGADENDAGTGIALAHFGEQFETAERVEMGFRDEQIGAFAEVNFQRLIA